MSNNSSSKKTEQSFGLDQNATNALDWERALARVIHDLRSDFIWAPHIRFIYTQTGAELIQIVKGELNAGTFHPGIPMTIEVPKPFRIKVGGPLSKRLGPSFTRPGSILLPKDRLLYQIFADEAAPLVEEHTDRDRSFSHRLSDSDDDAMFVSSRKSWSDMQNAIKEHLQDSSAKYILRVDVADYFGSINQHILINTLKEYGLDGALCDKLERLLLSYTGQRSSRGILQGIYPSDLLGAFYMSGVDTFFDDRGIPSARYVDDIYAFVSSVDAADNVLRTLIPFLRSYDLTLNEAKSTVMPKSALFAEEPDLEELFSNAVSEISGQIDDEDSDVDYGFQKDWNDDEDEEEGEDDDSDGGGDFHDLELEATKALFDSIDDFPSHEEAIERFCLPLFTKAESDYALGYVLDQLSRRPSMTQIYAAYLGKFVAGNQNVRDTLAKALDEASYYDWQKMWITAALMQAGTASKAAIKSCAALLNDANRHDGLRAVAAMFIGRYGDYDRRKALFQTYQNVSDYVKLAIYFSSRRWPGVERKNARDSWGGHSQLHKLMSKGLAK
ncbi:RNA-directed DNA polymerase [Sphingomonas sp.]|uniref:RNA-directed DNA polymerase n=1 Tax=Sphingomonas sp. TaxID=28214 RepID=UPI002FDB4297